MKQWRLRKFFVLLSLFSLVFGIFISLESNLSVRIISSKRYSQQFDVANYKSLQGHKSSINPKCNSTAKRVCESMGSDQNTSLSKTMTKKTSTLHEAIDKVSSTKNDTSAIQSKGTSEENEALPSTQTVDISGARKWRRLGNRKDIFVYSAYYRKEMRDIITIGVGRRKKNPSIVCTFPFSQGHPQVKASVEVLPEHHNRQNSAIYITCSLGVATTHMPSAVDLKVGTDTTRLPILFPKPRRFNFTVCLASFHGPYADYKAIIEMIETDLILGAQRFVMYNHSTSKQVDKILQHYVRRGLVELRPWHLPQMDVHYYGQLATIQDCILSSRNESKYLVLKDVDEVIAPHQHQNWNQMMEFLDDGGNHSTFLFRNAFFGTNWTKDNPDMLKTPSISSLKYIWRDKEIFEHRIRSKAIIKPELIQIGGIHFPYKVERYSDIVPVHASLALLHHYRKYKKPTKQVKDPTMLEYSDELLSNTKQTYKELHIL